MLSTARKTEPRPPGSAAAVLDRVWLQPVMAKNLQRTLARLGAWLFQVARHQAETAYALRKSLDATATSA